MLVILFWGDQFTCSKVFSTLYVNVSLFISGVDLVEGDHKKDEKKKKKKDSKEKESRELPKFNGTMLRCSETESDVCSFYSLFIS